MASLRRRTGVRTSQAAAASLLLSAALMAAGCGQGGGDTGGPGSDPELSKRGSIEVTAKLVEIPKDSIFQRDLYNYANVFKYEVLQVHRGKVKGQTIYVGHYNPFKPRSEAADQRVPDIGGNLKSFQAGQVHRMALDGSMFDPGKFSGGILNKYENDDTDPIYWAVWTNLVSE